MLMFVNTMEKLQVTISHINRRGVEMKKKIKDLTLEEVNNICKKHYEKNENIVVMFVGIVTFGHKK